MGVAKELALYVEAHVNAAVIGVTLLGDGLMVNLPHIGVWNTIGSVLVFIFLLQIVQR